MIANEKKYFMFLMMGHAAYVRKNIMEIDSRHDINFILAVLLDFTEKLGRLMVLSDPLVRIRRCAKNGRNNRAGSCNGARQEKNSK